MCFKIYRGAETWARHAVLPQGMGLLSMRNVDRGDGGQDRSRKNVLLIIVDQVIRDVLGTYVGDICQTPVLDNLSRQGITFDNAYTSISLCSPARASMLTGKLPHNHGILYNVTRHPYGRAELEEEASMISAFLLQAGYRCGYIGKWHIGMGKGPWEYGFEGTTFAGYGLPDSIFLGATPPGTAVS